MNRIIAGALFGGLLGGAAMALTQSVVRPRWRSAWIDSFSTWAGPPSMTADSRAERTERSVRDTLLGSLPLLATRQIKILSQGSSVNNTNVAHLADLDLIALDESTPWVVPAPGEQLPSHESGGLTLTAVYPDLASSIQVVLQSAFPGAVSRGKKCFKIQPTDSRAACDVLPAFRATWYRPQHQWSTHGREFARGIIFLDSNGAQHLSFPEQHLDNGRAKNVRTGYRYKQIVRILKKLRAEWQEDLGLLAPSLPSSFVIECLVFNVPDQILTNGDVFDAVYGALDWLSNTLANRDAANQFSKVNRVQLLFQHWGNGLLAQEPSEVSTCRNFAVQLRAALLATPR